jgi:general secretion pathway protein B
MSFILDALKKSETERQQSNSAEFAIVPTNPATPSVPRWLWVVGLLLAINLAVLIGILLRADEPAAVSVTTPAISEPEPEPQSTGSFEDRVAVARLNAPAKSDMRPVTVAEPESTSDLQAVLISQNPSSVSASQLYPTIQEVRASGTMDVPDLHLDIHVFSESPADRFVFINMTKLREGSRLENGPVVVEITPDGVVLRHLGKSFLVPRE